VELADDEFVDAVESCTLPNEQVDHRAHVRLAYLYLRRLGPAEARARIQQTILRYAAKLGAAHKYHVTITVAWMILVEHAAAGLPAEAGYETLLAEHPDLQNKAALDRYYSSELLASDAARQSFVEPDLAPLPALA
jgi:hypothetical protein